PGFNECNRLWWLEASWVFPKGHRIRLAISNSRWPTVWSTPHEMTSSLHLGGTDASRLVLRLVPVKPASWRVFSHRKLPITLPMFIRRGFSFGGVSLAGRV